ncbi:MAG TPA: hydantoinase/oxoprolinase family protein, partial [Gemmatimonadales bacterium]|nr:hydantoinase/oxoprolinase family protein [Gemmatimonadales bacterium]
LYDLSRHHPPPLVAREDVIGVRERHGPLGVIEALSDSEVARVTEQIRARAPESVAIALLFAFQHPEHERRLAAALRAALPNLPVAASHEVLPVFREYERTSTTTAEAYLRPKVASYLARTAVLAGERGVQTLRIMTSNGGTLEPQQAVDRAASLALSGPAGGVVGAQLVSQAVGVADILTLDMGGTSADASLITGGVALSEGAESVAGVPLAFPAILIETVSAGGGSIAAVDDAGALRVGPRSAGAVPGPACYGRGGTEPTVTDACLALGWLDPEYRLADGVELDRDAAERALATLGGDPRTVAAAIVEVATAVMARALKRVSVARGIDPRGMALLPFGGAGALFGCALADALGMSRVVVPPHPGVLSAIGLAAAPERVDLIASVHRALTEVRDGDLSRAYQPLLTAAAGALPHAVLTRFADCRFAGQGYEVTVPVRHDDPAAVGAAFRAAHQARHGHADPEQSVQVVNLRVVAERPSGVMVTSAAGRTKAVPPRAIVTRDGTSARANVWALGEIAAGTHIRGPAVLAGPDATALVEPGWHGVVHPSGAVVLERQ